MTATGIQLTQYRPAFAGIVGEAQPYVLAGLVHFAITYFYLRLASPHRMGQREVWSMVAAAPLVFLFVAWTVFMSSYSIMFERRSETAQVESGNQLQSIADELRDLDRQIAVNYTSTLTNLDQRLESELSKPEPGVIKGCGRRCREIRAVQSEMQNYQNLRAPVLGPPIIGADLARALGQLEGEQQTIGARLADFDAALSKFGRLNTVLAERAVTAAGTLPVEEGTSRLSAQFRGHLERLRIKLAGLRDNERNLTDSKYRGLTELVNDLSSVVASGQVPRILDMVTILLIAVAPDFLSVIMALLSRTLVVEPESESVRTEVDGLGVMMKRLRRNLFRRSNAKDMEQVKAVVKEHLSARVRSDIISPAPAMAPIRDYSPEPPPRVATGPSGEPKVKEPESIYQTLEKLSVPSNSRSRPGMKSGRS
ncbi:MAG: hypothetical protein WCF85_00600 [Rhodospirillaceae bacterium]